MQEIRRDVITKDQLDAMSEEQLARLREVQDLEARELALSLMRGVHEVARTSEKGSVSYSEVGLMSELAFIVCPGKTR